MNICLLIGEICSTIQFDFILNGKDISIVRFNIKLSNGSILKVKGYNEIADYCYRNLKEGDVVLIEGTLNSKIEVFLKGINKNKLTSNLINNIIS